MTSTLVIMTRTRRRPFANIAPRTLREMLTRNLIVAVLATIAFGLFAGPFYGDHNANFNGTADQTDAQRIATETGCKPATEGVEPAYGIADSGNGAEVVTADAAIGITHYGETGTVYYLCR